MTDASKPAAAAPILRTQITAGEDRGAPSIKIQTPTAAYAVRFSPRILEKIEEATGDAIFVVTEWILSLNPESPKNPDGSPKLGEDKRPLPPTDEARKDASRRFRMGTARRIVSGAMCISLDKLDEAIPPEDFLNVYRAIGSGVVTSALQLVGDSVEETDERDPADHAAGAGEALPSAPASVV